MIVTGTCNQICRLVYNIQEQRRSVGFYELCRKGFVLEWPGAAMKPQTAGNKGYSVVINDAKLNEC